MERRLKDLLKDGNFGLVSTVHAGRMRSIASRGNRSTERKARAMIARAGMRGWKMHAADIPGNPDFCFMEQKVAVFIDGCYWHGCKRCSHAVRQNRAYWSAKIEGNRHRDKRTTKMLLKMGYRVIRVWEHELTRSGCLWLCRLSRLLVDRENNGQKSIE